MYKKKYKRPLRTIEEEPVTGKTGFLHVFFTLFSGWIPIWGMEAHHATYLPWLLRPTREGAQGGAPSAIQAGAGGLT